MSYFRDRSQDAIKMWGKDSSVPRSPQRVPSVSPVERRRRMSTKSDDASAMQFNFSFQDEQDFDKSEFAQNLPPINWNHEANIGFPTEIYQEQKFTLRNLNEDCNISNT